MQSVTHKQIHNYHSFYAVACVSFVAFVCFVFLLYFCWRIITFLQQFYHNHVVVAKMYCAYVLCVCVRVRACVLLCVSCHHGTLSEWRHCGMASGDEVNK